MGNFGYIPLNYEQIDIAAGTYFPSQIKAYNNQAFMFWQRAFFQRACSTMIIKLPKRWRRYKDFFYWCLFAYGFVGVSHDAVRGDWFNPGTLNGYDFYYQPTQFILSNPNIKSGEKQIYEIGTQCEIIKLTPDFRGIFDIITYCAEKAACMDVAINTAIINSKLAFFFGAKNKAAAAVLKKLFDKINAGEPAVFFDSKLANDGTDKDQPWQEFTRSVKDSYILTDLLRDFQTIINMFDNEIGIPTIPYQKKERLVTDEANSKQLDATSRAVVWYETLSNSIELANEFLKLDGDNALSVKLRFTPEQTKEVSENGTQ